MLFPHTLPSPTPHTHTHRPQPPPHTTHRPQPPPHTHTHTHRLPPAPSQEPLPSQCVQYGELELFLLGQQLGELLPLFRQHKVQFSDLMSLTERDLEMVCECVWGWGCVWWAVVCACAGMCPHWSVVVGTNHLLGLVVFTTLKIIRRSPVYTVCLYTRRWTGCSYSYTLN